jgi:hypothetical protein
MNLSSVETMSWTPSIATAGASAQESLNLSMRDAFAFEPEHRLLRLVEGDIDAQS